MPLKIKQRDLEILQAAIAPLDTTERRAAYISGKFPYAERCRNRDMRYRWDLLYATRIRIGDGAGMSGDLNLYSYLCDTHIDAALRSFIKPLSIPTVTTEPIAFRKLPIGACFQFDSVGVVYIKCDEGYRPARGGELLTCQGSVQVIPYHP